MTRAVFEDEALRDEVRIIMLELISLARASGTPLAAVLADELVLGARSFPIAVKTSIQTDFEAMGRRDERDLFAGAMLRMGHELGIETPGIRAVAALLEERKPRRPAWQPVVELRLPASGSDSPGRRRENLDECSIRVASGSQG